jgi:UDP-4-amino-4-deoxy-L-arabinose-oxoglutarate aminotransferase
MTAHSPPLTVAKGDLIPHSSPWLVEADRQAVADVLASGQLVSGAICRAFESALADRLGGGFALTASSGASALMWGLAALDIGVGDEVILPTYVCDSVQRAVSALGATPVLCDVGPGWTMTAETVQAVRTERTRAVVVVHIFGLVADVAGIARLGLPVIEDACQALGSVSPTSGGWVGADGVLGIFSFHATKCLTTGEGGAVFTRDEEMGARLRALREQDVRYRPISDLAAALGLSQLGRYDETLTRRRVLLDHYLAALPSGWTAPFQTAAAGTNGFRLPLQVAGNFEAHRIACAQVGVALRRGVDTLLHRPAQSDAAFPGASSLYAVTRSIPLYPGLTLAEADRVIDCLRASLPHPVEG